MLLEGIKKIYIFFILDVSLCLNMDLFIIKSLVSYDFMSPYREETSGYCKKAKVYQCLRDECVYVCVPSSCNSAAIGIPLEFLNYW